MGIGHKSEQVRYPKPYQVNLFTDLTHRIENTFRDDVCQKIVRLASQNVSISAIRMPNS